MNKKFFSFLKDRTLKTLALDSIAGIFVKGMGAILAFTMFAVLSQAMGEENYGVFASIFSIATLFSLAGSLGQRTLILRFGPIYFKNNKDSHLNGIIRFGLKLIFSGCFFFGFMCILLSLFFPSFLLTKQAVLVTFLALIIALIEYQSNLIRVLKNVVYALFPKEIVLRLIIILVAVASIYKVDEKYSSDFWLLFIAVAYLIVFTWQSFKYYFEKESIFNSSADYSIQNWRKPIFSMWSISVITVILGLVSVFMIEKISGPSDAAKFFAALRTSQLVNIFTLITSLICSPILASAFQYSNKAEVQKVSSMVAVITSFGASIGCLVVVFFGEIFLLGFGDNFYLAMPALLILSISHAFSAIMGPTMPIMQMSGHDSYMLKIISFSNILGLVCMPFAINYGGIIGAALCCALCNVCWNLFTWIYIKVHHDVDSSIFGILKNA